MNIFFIIFAVAAAILVISLLAIFKLREKYMVTWIGLAFFVFLFGVFFKKINGLAEILGFKVYSNFLFLFFGICIGFLVFQLSLNLSRQEDKIQTLAEELAILKSIGEKKDDKK
jgi:hypothetical protein